MISRRHLLRDSGLGFGTVALAQLLSADRALGAPRRQPVPVDLKPRNGPFPARAKAVIQLMQNGGPSQMDLFDPKPELNRSATASVHRKRRDLPDAGSEANAPVAASVQVPQARPVRAWSFPNVLPTHRHDRRRDLPRPLDVQRAQQPHRSPDHAHHRQDLSRAALARRLGQLRARHARTRTCPPTSCSAIPEGYNTTARCLAIAAGCRPSTTAPSSTPGLAGARTCDPAVAAARWRAAGQPRLPRPAQRRAPPPVSRASRSWRRDPQLRAGRADAAAAPAEVLDISRESAATRRLYGLDNPITAGYGTRCLMARRLVEAGVRFVQVFPP